MNKLNVLIGFHLGLASLLAMSPAPLDGIRISALTGISVTGPSADMLTGLLEERGVPLEGQLESSGRQITNLKCYVRPLAFPSVGCDYEVGKTQFHAPYDFARAIVGFLQSNEVSPVFENRQQNWSYDAMGCYRVSKGGADANLSCYFNDHRLAAVQPGEALVANVEAKELSAVVGETPFDGVDTSNGRKLSLHCRATSCVIEAYPLDLVVDGEKGNSLVAGVTGDAAHRLFDLLPGTATEEPFSQTKQFVSSQKAIEINCTLEQFGSHCTMTLR